MQFKKFALRGMIILAVVLALCVLFSGTLRTLTTPKVRIAQTKNAKLETTVELKGKVVFPKDEEMTIRLPEGLGLTVTKVHVAVGEEVTKGQKLMSTEVTDAEKTLTTLQASYEEAKSTLDAWKRKNGDIRLTRNENLWIEAYDAAREAEKKELEARLAVMTELNTTNAKKVTEKAVKKAGENAVKLYEEWQETVKEMEAAQKRQSDLDRFAVEDSVWTTLQTKRDAEKKQKEAEDQMMKIRLMQKQLGVITAPHNGYIVEIKKEKDSQLTGENVLFLMTPEDTQPVLRAETKDVKQTIQKGTVITVPLENGKKVETKVVATGLTDTGVPYIDAEITKDVIYELGKVSTMVKQESIDLKLINRASQSTWLIKAGAVRKDSEGSYIYELSEHDSALGGKETVIYRRSVKVLAENSEWVSVEDELNYGTEIVYMEDRDIKAGDVVMKYE